MEMYRVSASASSGLKISAMACPGTTRSPRATPTMVTRPVTRGVTVTWRYAFGSTTPGSRSPVWAVPVVTGATAILARRRASGVSVTTAPADASAAGGEPDEDDTADAPG